MIEFWGALWWIVALWFVFRLLSGLFGGDE
jgi:hypothetical protein